MNNVWTPDAERLAAGLNHVLRARSLPADDVVIVRRDILPYSSSFPAEIVHCLMADGRELRLLCKYGVGRGSSGFGHRGGVSYEARVYRDILAFMKVGTAGYWGTYVNPAGGESWLVLDYLASAERLTKTRDPYRWLVEAAKWIGHFHARGFATGARHETEFLNRYSLEYFTRWAERACRLTTRWHDEVTWLPALCRGFSANCGPLVESDQTVVHGEYYPKNILISGLSVRPVDWESTAVAAGAIDLASLTEGRWPVRVVQESVKAYCDARWGDGVPRDFETMLMLSRLYLHLRWVGESEDWASRIVGLRHERSSRVAQMEDLGERLGYL